MSESIDAMHRLMFLARWAALNERERKWWRPMLEDWQVRVLKDTEAT